MAPRQRRGQARRAKDGTGRRLTSSWLLWGGAAAVALVILIATALSRSGSDGDASAPPAAERPIAAPDFLLTLYQGGEMLGAEELEFSSLFSQGKPVVLNFWAGLCPPCRAEMPGFQEVYDELGDQFVLLGLDIGPFIGLGSREDGQRLLRELDITYPAGTTFEEGVVAEYRVRGMPTTVFLTASGEIAETQTGLLDEKTFRNKVESLLQSP